MSKKYYTCERCGITDALVEFDGYFANHPRDRFCFYALTAEVNKLREQLAAVTVTEEMVEAYCEAKHGGWWDEMTRAQADEERRYARGLLTPALTAAHAQQTSSAAGVSVMTALRDLLRYVERQQCWHDETERRGAIWTVCTMCGKKWADDEGGFVPYEEPAAITNARTALTAALTAASEGASA